MESLSCIDGYLEGKCLVATPQMKGTVFEKTVIYLCAHSKDGAMGLIVNNQIDDQLQSLILQSLNITKDSLVVPNIYFGGPVDPFRGFVLHSDDHMIEQSKYVSNGIALTSNISMMNDISSGLGPKHSLVTLGYAGWSSGQLEDEILQNCWLCTYSSPQMIFERLDSEKWHHAYDDMGVNMFGFTAQTGNA